MPKKHLGILEDLDVNDTDLLDWLADRAFVEFDEGPALMVIGRGKLYYQDEAARDKNRANIRELIRNQMEVAGDKS